LYEALPLVVGKDVEAVGINGAGSSRE